MPVLVLISILGILGSVSGAGCPSCKEVLGNVLYSGVYTLVAEGTPICPDECLYKDQKAQHFCFKPGGFQVRECTDVNSDKNRPSDIDTTTILPTTSTTTTLPATTTEEIDNDYFFLGGGSGSNGKSRTIGCYGESGQMMEAPLLPADIVGGVGGVVGDLIQVCGSSTPRCWTWSPLSKATEWVESAPYRQLTYPSGISVDGHFWVTGGMMVITQDTDLDPEPEVNLLLATEPGSGSEDDFNPYADMNIDLRNRAAVDPTSTYLYRYNDSTGLVSLIPGHNLKSQRWGHCATILEGNVVLTGGVDFTVAGFYLNLVETYSIENGYLETLPSMNGKRLNHGCTTFAGLDGPTLIVAGGWYGGYIDSAEILPPGGSWVTVAPLPQMRNFLHMTTMNGAGVVIGGGQYLGGWQYRNTSLRYDQENNSWVEMEELSLDEGNILKHLLFTIPERLVLNTH